LGEEGPRRENGATELEDVRVGWDAEEEVATSGEWEVEGIGSEHNTTGTEGVKVGREDERME